MTDLKKNRITEGNILQGFLLFILPLMAASALQQSYVIADGLIVGNCVSENAMGAVSSSGPIVEVLTLIQIGLSGGTSICVSHLYGSKHFADLKQLIRNIIIVLSLISLVFAVLGVIFAHPVLRFMHTPSNIIEEASIYLTITCIGIPFMALYNVQAGILRGMGDSKKPLSGIAVSTAVNIGLDLLLVPGAGMGITGAAIATVSAELFSSLFILTRLIKKIRELDTLIVQDDSFALTESAGEQLGECVRLGVPQMLQSALTSLGKVLLQNVVNVLGACVVIGVSAAYKVDSIVVIPLMSMSIGVSVYVGQNIGAGRFDRTKEVLKLAVRLSLAVSIIMTIVLFALGKPMLGLFGLSSESIAEGYQYILICLPFYWAFGLQFILNGFLQGCKKTAQSSAYSMIALVARVATAYLLAGTFGSAILPAAESLSWCIGAGLAGITAYRYIKNIDLDLDKD